MKEKVAVKAERGNSMCGVGGVFKKILGINNDVSTPEVKTPDPTPSVVDNGDTTTGTDEAAKKAKKKRGFAFTRTAVDTALSSSDSTGKKTLG